MKKMILKIPYLSLFDLFVHQRSALWTKIRDSGDCLYFGASQIGIIFGVNPYQAFSNYWHSKLSSIITNEIDIEFFMKEEKKTTTTLIDIPDNSKKPEENTKKALLLEEIKEINTELDENVLRGKIVRSKDRKYSRKDTMMMMKTTTSNNSYLKRASYNGIKYEPIAINVFEDLMKLRVIRDLGILRHRDMPYVGGSPDGFIPEINSGLEIKVPFMKDPHQKFPDDITLIKDYIFIQCITLLSIFKCNKWMLFYYEPKSRCYSLFEIVDTNSSAFNELLKTKIDQFYSSFLDACEYLKINDNCSIEDCIAPRLFNRNEKRIFLQKLQESKRKCCRLIRAGYIADGIFEEKKNKNLLNKKEEPNYIIEMENNSSTTNTTTTSRSPTSSPILTHFETKIAPLPKSRTYSNNHNNNLK